MHVQELCRRLGAACAPDLDLEITGVATVEDGGEGDLTFLANPRYEARLARCEASAVLVTPDFAGASRPALLRAPNPYLLFARAITLFHEPVGVPPGVHPTAVLGEDVLCGDGVGIGAYAVIGDHVRIGDGTQIHPHAVVYEGAEIGPGCVLHSLSVVRERVKLRGGVILQNGAVVGADGFGFAPRGDGSYEKILQAGGVELEEDVEVQANACVDRAAVGTTTVGRGTKIDNLVQIGHGCHVGEDGLLCGQVGLAGSTRVGDRVTMAGQVGVAGHLDIGDDVVLAAQSGVPNHVPTRGFYGGSPVVDLKRYRQCIVLYNKLPEMAKRLKDLERQVKEMQRALDEPADR